MSTTMSNTMAYQGYTTSMTFDTDDKIIVGRVLDIDDIISFHGSSVAEFEAAFHAAVDGYRAACAQLGSAPEKPASGKLICGDIKAVGLERRRPAGRGGALHQLGLAVGPVLTVHVHQEAARCQAYEGVEAAPVGIPVGQHAGQERLLALGVTLRPLRDETLLGLGRRLGGAAKGLRQIVIGMQARQLGRLGAEHLLKRAVAAQHFGRRLIALARCGSVSHQLHPGGGQQP